MYKAAGILGGHDPTSLESAGNALGTFFAQVDGAHGELGGATLAVWLGPSLGLPWLALVEAPLPRLRRRVRMAKARWRIELDDRELQEELGLDLDEGRHWLGWHHHVCWVSIAYACLRAEMYSGVLYFFTAFICYSLCLNYN
jgi:hypothetical protein